MTLSFELPAARHRVAQFAAVLLPTLFAGRLPVCLIQHNGCTIHTFVTDPGDIAGLCNRVAPITVEFCIEIDRADNFEFVAHWEQLVAFARQVGFPRNPVTMRPIETRHHIRHAYQVSMDRCVARGWDALETLFQETYEQSDLNMVAVRMWPATP